MKSVKNISILIIGINVLLLLYTCYITSNITFFLKNCTAEAVEHGLRKLNLVCNSSDTRTYKTCRMLERLKVMMDLF